MLVLTNNTFECKGLVTGGSIVGSGKPHEWLVRVKSEHIWARPAFEKGKSMSVSVVESIWGVVATDDPKTLIEKILSRGKRVEVSGEIKSLLESIACNHWAKTREEWEPSIGLIVTDLEGRAHYYVTDLGMIVRSTSKVIAVMEVRGNIREGEIDINGCTITGVSEGVSLSDIVKLEDVSEELPWTSN